MTVYDSAPVGDGAGVEFVECPKCHSQSARYKQMELDLVLTCLCGLHKVVSTKLEMMTIEHIDSAENVRLPEKGSMLWDCLATLFGLEPASSQEVLDSVNAGRDSPLTMSQVSSQLTALKYKGLVDVAINNKGHAGGSTWVLTLPARKAFGG